MKLARLDWKDPVSRERLMLSLNLFLQFLGHGIYGVFVPVFLMNNGAGMAGVTMFALADGLGAIIAATFGYVAIRRLSLKVPLLFRAMVQPLWLLWLRNFPTHPAPVALYGLTFGFYTTTYWLGVNSYVVDSTSRDDRGTFVGITSAIVWIASIAAPFIGGIVIGSNGYDAVFNAATVLLLLAAIPALLLPDRRAREMRPPRATKKAETRAGSLFVLFAISGATVVAVSYLWPAYVYQLFGDALSVGAFASLGSLFSLAGAMGGGWLADKTSKTRLMAAAAVATSLSWFFSTVILGPVALSVVVALRSLGSETASNALFAKFGNMISEGKIIEFMAQKQLMQGAGQTIAAVVAVGVPFLVTFVLFGMMYLFYAAVISETKFKEGDLAVPRWLVSWLGRAYGTERR